MANPIRQFLSTLPRAATSAAPRRSGTAAAAGDFSRHHLGASGDGAITRRRAVAVAVVALLAVALAGCGGSGDGESAATTGKAASKPALGSSNAGAPRTQDRESGPVANPSPAGEDSAQTAGGKSGGGSGLTAGPGGAARVLPSDRDVIYRGSIRVRVRDIGKAVDRAEDLALGAEGVVFSEQTSTDPKRPRFGEATMTLRVPPTAFGPTLDGLGNLGKELDRRRSAEDVTTQVTDTASRLKTQQRSVERVRVLLSRAKTIGQVVLVESELSRREADLESLEAQLKKLNDLADLATIDVTLVSPPPQHHKPKPKHEDNLGFLTGLRGGWDAFVGVVVVALTVLGALMPFAIAAAVIGVPLLLIWRSRRRTPAPPPPTGPTPADA